MAKKTSAELTAKADELQKKLAKLRKDARDMKLLEEKEAAEAKLRAEIQFAHEFVEFTKRKAFGETGKSYFDVLSEEMAKESAPNNVEAETDDIPELDDEDESFDEQNTTNGYQGYR